MYYIYYNIYIYIYFFMANIDVYLPMIGMLGGNVAQILTQVTGESILR
jgi:hypothetical protein